MKTRVGYEANPNGNLWLKDNSGFGQKMLAKMGWKEGQGLGRTEQGITAAIRVSRKRDNRGVGCSRQWAEEGSAQMDAFSAVLADLNRQHDSPARPEEQVEGADPPMGLEESSRLSRNRLHYAKFTRGKDLSRCSEQALLSIMGPRGVPQEKEEETVAAAGSEAKTEAEDTGVRHVQSSLSTAEYFAQKMEAMRARLKASASAPNLCEYREEEGKEEGEVEEAEEEAFSVRPTFQLGGDRDDLEDGEISQQSTVVPTSPTAVEADEADDEKLERKKRKEERKRRRKERETAEVEDCVQEEDQEVLSSAKEKEERRRRREEKRRRRQEMENSKVEDYVQEEDQEILSVEKEKEERRRRKEERRRRRQEQHIAEKAEEKEEGEVEVEMSPEQKCERVEETIEALPSAGDPEETSKRQRKKKKRKNRERSSESEEEEAIPKKRKARPSSATMTKEEAASFAVENEKILQHLEWSAFSTSNLGFVVGYKYGAVSW